MTGYINKACDVDEILRESRREHKPSFIYINSTNNLNVYNSTRETTGGGDEAMIDRTPGN